MNEQGDVVVVTGGRDYNDVPQLFQVLDKRHKKRRIGMIIEGASDDVTGPYKGVDFWVRQWAWSRSVPCVTHHADWVKYGKAAGPIRNKRMIDDARTWGPVDYVLVFPGGRGTNSMKSIAKKMKVKTVNAFAWMV